ncbi:MAG: S1 RNA-binding domain-containing protein, partial [Paludibacteraceae bacterium]|nr:S1 RNA-binding domain-containing protein [Paludibacteraceae bacterium]
SITEVEDKGVVEIAATNKASIDAAVAKIKGIIAVPEVGEVYESIVKSIMPYGAFVEFLPGKEGLLHISEISWNRIEDMEHAGLKEGDSISVKLLDIDKKSGKFKLSHKVLTERPAREPREPKAPRAPKEPKDSQENN